MNRDNNNGINVSASGQDIYMWLHQDNFIEMFKQLVSNKTMDQLVVIILIGLGLCFVVLPVSIDVIQMMNYIIMKQMKILIYLKITLLGVLL